MPDAAYTLFLLALVACTHVLHLALGIHAEGLEQNLLAFVQAHSAAR